MRRPAVSHWHTYAWSWAEKIAMAAAAAAFILWSRAFILASSFMTIDQQRSFSLFDDAMISMRYAWNLSHGYGLVWNSGEYVLGYSNLLMTLLMSLATAVFSKSTAVLFIQVLGVAFVLAAAVLTVRIADHILEPVDPKTGIILRTLSFICCLAYYPLAFWSLEGMETGLLTALALLGIVLAFDHARFGTPISLVASSVSFGLAYLTRNDSLFLFLVIWGFLAWNARNGSLNLRYRHLIASAGFVILVILAEVLFRYAYYGSVLPNTYTLKLTGMPVALRLQNGLGFSLPFLQQTFMILTLAVLGAVLRPTSAKAAMLLSFIVMLAYQVYVGGDAWSYWRFTAPTIPLLLVLDTAALAMISDASARAIGNRRSGFLASGAFARLLVALGVGIGLLMGLDAADEPFIRQIKFLDRPYHTHANKLNVDTAIALNDLLGPDASIGVVWAGALPYYAPFRAVDFLGKSDKHIASLPPDTTGSVSWAGITSVPGHNKYDLSYSILALRPTYVQGLAWGRQDLTTLAEPLYVTIQYKGLTLYLLRDSPDVLWHKLDLP